MQLHQQVEKFWASESYGFGNECDNANSVEDNTTLEILEGTTSLKNGRYEVGLLTCSEMTTAVCRTTDS